jgi:hypothetical protein
MPSPIFVENTICSCSETTTCPSCLFCEEHNTTSGRKALGEKIVTFLVWKPFYQKALKQAMERLFPDRVVYDDEKDICTMLFDSLLFEDISSGITPLAYFVDHAGLADVEKRLYEAWRQHTHYGFFVIEKLIAGKEIHVTDLTGRKRYRVYETNGTATMKEGAVIVARIVPFLMGWMITTETVLSWSGDTARQQVQRKYGAETSQFAFTEKYLAEHRRRMA